MTSPSMSTTVGAPRDERDPKTEHHRPNVLPNGHERDDFDFEYLDGVAGPIRFPAQDGSKVWCKRHGWEPELAERCLAYHFGTISGQCAHPAGHDDSHQIHIGAGLAVSWWGDSRPEDGAL